MQYYAMASFHNDGLFTMYATRAYADLFCAFLYFQTEGITTAVLAFVFCLTSFFTEGTLGSRKENLRGWL